MLYAPKPIVVDAYQLTMANIAHEASWPDWLDALVAANKLRFSTDVSANILARVETELTEWQLTADDWLIRLPNGEVIPCPPELFDLMWDAAPATASLPQEAAPHG